MAARTISPMTTTVKIAQPRAFPTSRGIKSSEDVRVEYPCGCVERVSKNGVIPPECGFHPDPELKDYGSPKMQRMRRYASLLIDEHDRIWVSWEGHFLLGACPQLDSDLHRVVEALEQVTDATVIQGA